MGDLVSKKLLGSLCLFSAAVSLTGCAFDRDFKDPTVAVLPSQDAGGLRGGAIQPGGGGEVQIEALPAQYSDGFVVKPVLRQGRQRALPAIEIDGLSLTEAGLQDALQMILAGSGVTLGVEGGRAALDKSRGVTLTRVSGKLDHVLDQMADSMGFFWGFDGRVLTIEAERPFVMSLPPSVDAEAFAGMANTIRWLGAQDVYLDKTLRTVSFKCGSKALERIEQYMASVRETRSLLVYEVKIYQVDLSDSSEQGINWNAMAASDLARGKALSATMPVGLSTSDVAATDLSSAAALTRSGAGLGAVIATPYFSVDALVAFLKTQGQVKTVSQPRLTMLNGGQGMIRVGQSTTYLAKVGSNLSSGISQVTVETKDLRTGVELKLRGDESDNTVYTNIDLKFSELNVMTKSNVMGTELKLPTVDDRELSTSVRLPPGYTVLLGGIFLERDASQRDIGASTNYRTGSVKRSELVVTLQPMIVRFGARDNGAKTGARGRDFSALPSVDVKPDVISAASAAAAFNSAVGSRP